MDGIKILATYILFRLLLWNVLDFCSFCELPEAEMLVADTSANPAFHCCLSDKAILFQMLTHVEPDIRFQLFCGSCLLFEHLKNIKCPQQSPAAHT